MQKMESLCNIIEKQSQRGELIDLSTNQVWDNVVLRIRIENEEKFEYSLDVIFEQGSLFKIKLPNYYLPGREIFYLTNFAKIAYFFPSINNKEGYYFIVYEYDKKAKDLDLEFRNKLGLLNYSIQEGIVLNRCINSKVNFNGLSGVLDDHIPYSLFKGKLSFGEIENECDLKILMKGSKSSCFVKFTYYDKKTKTHINITYKNQSLKFEDQRVKNDYMILFDNNNRDFRFTFTSLDDYKFFSNCYNRYVNSLDKYNLSSISSRKINDSVKVSEKVDKKVENGNEKSNKTCFNIEDELLNHNKLLLNGDKYSNISSEKLQLTSLLSKASIQENKLNIINSSEIGRKQNLKVQKIKSNGKDRKSKGAKK